MLVGLLLAAVLFVIGVGTALRQRRTLHRLREERYLPSDDRTYLRGQIRRRFATSAVLILIGGMIGGAFLSGMESRADELGERAKARAAAEAQPGEPLPPAPDDADRQFARIWGGFWIAVLLLVFVAVLLAVFDFWATRVYWMARYREMKADHEAKLQRDLAVYRQQKLNARMKGPRKEDPNPDDTGENPPVS